MHTGPLPSPHKQCWTVASRIFFEFQLCIGLGEEELQEIMHCFKRELRNDRKNMIIAVVSQAGDSCLGLLLLSEKKELL